MDTGDFEGAATMSRTHTLIVNGLDRSVSAADDMPLLHALRNELGLKGTRAGCGEGHCGACTVQVDGRAVQSCTTPMWSVVGKHVRTVEGLGTPAALHPLQQAFIAEQAAQCGYCINGILLSVNALLERVAAPTEAEIAATLARHLCRCGSQFRILRAIRRALRQRNEDRP